ncbi:uncharacterized protein RJT21DRAFT_36436 [Scheffersomyces amazonensis]|uniref:uncharacterized protein n=1 Tax=Scheffersomyces amazonensis TaxID=1078765 RepID=UPI00315D877A
MSCNGTCGEGHNHSNHNIEVNEIKIDHSHNINMEDVWGDDDGDEYDIPFKADADIKRIHEKQGYLDGLSRAKEESLQQGFDEGFPQGAEFGIIVGKIMGKLKLFKDDDLFNQARKELNITKVLDKKYFNDDLTLTTDHQVLQKWMNLVEALDK